MSKAGYMDYFLIQHVLIQPVLTPRGHPGSPNIVYSAFKSTSFILNYVQGWAISNTACP